MERVVELKPYLAHVRRKDDGSCATHDIEQHLRAVGGMVQCVIA
ncbi:MAG: hypothetical protein OJF50_002048 [Nitrospira sp.]|nr:hypothetical protein [Nitrospira sp.]